MTHLEILWYCLQDFEVIAGYFHKVKGKEGKRRRGKRKIKERRRGKKGDGASAEIFPNLTAARRMRKLYVNIPPISAMKSITLSGKTFQPLKRVVAVFSCFLGLNFLPFVTKCLYNINNLCHTYWNASFAAHWTFLFPFSARRVVLTLGHVFPI